MRFVVRRDCRKVVGQHDRFEVGACRLGPIIETQEHLAHGCRPAGFRQHVGRMAACGTPCRSFAAARRRARRPTGQMRLTEKGRRLRRPPRTRRPKRRRARARKSVVREWSRPAGRSGGDIRGCYTTIRRVDCVRLARQAVTHFGIPCVSRARTDRPDWRRDHTIWAWSNAWAGIRASPANGPRPTRSRPPTRASVISQHLSRASCPAPGVRYRFGPFVLSPGQRLLLRDGAEIRLIPRYFDLR